MIYTEELTPEQRKARMDDLKEQLKAVIAAGRNAADEYEQRIAEFKRLEASATAATNDATNQQARLNEHLVNRPDEFLATEEEMAPWEAKLATLNRELEQLRDIRNSADRSREQCRPLAVQAAKNVEYLQRGALNIRNEMEATIQIRRR
jgi:chromosome segregation ATPase